MPLKSSNQSSASFITQLIFISMGFALVFLIFIIYNFQVSPERSSKPIKLAIGEWAPYTGEELEANGIATAIVTKVLHEIDYQPEYKFMSWPIAEEKAASGEKDDDIRGTFPYTEHEDRKSRFYFSSTILSIEFAVFYHIKNNPAGVNIRQIEDLYHHHVLAIDGYEYPEGIRKFISREQRVMRDNLEAFIELEKSVEPLVVVEALEVGEQLLEQKLPHLVRYIHPAPLRKSLDVKLMLSKNNPNNLALLKDFNEELQKFKSNENAYSSFQTIIKNRIDLSRAVLLEPFGQQSFVQAYKNKEKEEVILLPKGSKALVKEWDEPFLHYRADMDNTVNTLIKIKLLNGPFSLKNCLLYVDGRTIRLP